MRKDDALLVLTGAAIGGCLASYYYSRKKSETSSPSPLEISKWKPLEYSVLFGVVGGLGPQAMAYFIELIVLERCKIFNAMKRANSPQQRFIALSNASTSVWTEEEAEQVWEQTKGRNQLLDQDHAPVLAAQATTVPPRPKYILKESLVDPTPQLTSVANGLVAAGATHLAVICNTAHYFWPAVQNAVKDATCVDMVRMTLDYVARLVGKENKVNIGLFATKATIRTRMYQDSAEKYFKYQLVSPLSLPDGEERQAEVEKVIFSEHGIKSGFDNPDKTPEARESLKVLLREALILKRKLGCNIVILGCSELPLLLNHDSIERWGAELFGDVADRDELRQLRFIDPGCVLAHEILHLTLLSRARSTS